MFLNPTIGKSSTMNTPENNEGQILASVARNSNGPESYSLAEIAQRYALLVVKCTLLCIKWIFMMFSKTKIYSCCENFNF